MSASRGRSVHPAVRLTVALVSVLAVVLSAPAFAVPVDRSEVGTVVADASGARHFELPEGGTVSVGQDGKVVARDAVEAPASLAEMAEMAVAERAAAPDAETATAQAAGGASVGGSIQYPSGVSSTDPDNTITVTAYLLDQSDPDASEWVASTASTFLGATWNIDDLAPGTYVFAYSGGPTLAGWVGGPARADATQFDLTGDETRTGADITLVLGGSLRGRVTVPSGFATSDIDVTLHVLDALGEWSVAGRTSVGADGTYRFGALATGDYAVEFIHRTGALPTVYTGGARDLGAVVPSAVTVQQDTAGVDVSLTVGRRVSGRVVGDDETPVVADLLVALVAWDGKVWQPVDSYFSSDGRFTFDGVRPGSYRLAVDFAGASSHLPAEPVGDSGAGASQVVVTAAADVTDARAVVRRAGSVVGSVAGPDGIDLTRFVAVAYPVIDGVVAQWGVSADVAEDGSYVVAGVTPGPTVVIVSDREDEFSTRFVGGGRSFTSAARYDVPAGGQASLPGVVMSTVLAFTETLLAADVSVAETVTLRATVESDGDLLPRGYVAFRSAGTLLGNATVVDRVAVLTLAQAPGAHDYSADFISSDAELFQGSSSATITATVLTAVATTTVLTADVSQPGKAILSATVTAAGGAATPGQIQFTAGGARLALVDVVNGRASFALETAPGTYTFRATYMPPPGLLGPSEAPAVTDVVAAEPSPAVTATAVVADTSVAGRATLRASVTSPETAVPVGTVAFLEGGTTLAVARLNAGVASAVVDLPAGAHTVVAEFRPDDAQSFAGSRSAEQRFTVIELDPTAPDPVATTVTLGADTAVPGQLGLKSVVSVATGAAPQGSVVFLDGDTTLAVVPLAGGVAETTLVLPARAYRVRAQFRPQDAKLHTASVSSTVAATVKAVVAPPKPVAKVLVMAKAPKVSGKAKVGRTLKASKGTWKSSGRAKVTVKLQWETKKGTKAVKVKGATTSKLKLTKKLRKKQIRLKVTVTAPGHMKVVRTTKWGKKVA